jgi:hypothetical protein
MNKQFTNAVKESRAPDGYDASFTASTPAIDRHETVIPQNNWKLANFNVNPIIGYNHYVWGDEGGGMFGGTGIGNPDTVIGKGHAYLHSVGNLQLDIKFDDVSNNEIAEKVKAKIENGFLSSVSVGFVEKTEGRWIDKEGKEVRAVDADLYEYGEVELMEVSVVNLPANPEALVMSKEAEIDELKKQLKSMEALKSKVKDVGEHMQTVGSTLSIFDEPTVTADDVDPEVEYLEDQRIQKEQQIKKRKAQIGRRRTSI